MRVVDRTCGGCASPLWWVVPLVALWSDLHVECMFGVALVGLFAICELLVPSVLTRRDVLRAAGIATVCVGAMLANPYGIGIFRYIFENVSVPQILDIAELRPPRWPTYRAFFVYLIVAAVLFVTQFRKLTLWETAAALACAVLGLRYIRLTPLVVIVTAPAVAARLGALITRGLDGRTVVFVALVAVLFISRVPPRLYAHTWRTGDGGGYPTCVLLRGRGFVHAGERVTRADVQQHEPRRLAGVDDVSGCSGLRRQPVAGVSAGAFPADHGRR